MVVIVMIIVCNILNPNFLSTRNIANIAAQISVTTILAFGETLLVICGLLDLSCGSVLALAGVLSVYIFKETGSIVVSFGAGLFFGVVCNYVIPAFIATLAMMTMARGGALLFTRGQNIYQIGDYVWFGQGQIGFIPVPVLFMVIIGILTWYILGHTKFGRSLYAVGGNEEAARASGINIGRIKIGAYLINGAFVGLAGILLMSRTNVGAPNAGQGYEFEALTAAIIGGTSFSGGLGTAGGTLAGAFIVGFLNNIMNLVGVDSYLQQVIKGAIIALAVGYDMWAKVNRTKKTLGAAKLSNKPKEAKP
jgi:inositol transport system permease protein